MQKYFLLWKDNKFFIKKLYTKLTNQLYNSKKIDSSYYFWKKKSIEISLVLANENEKNYLLILKYIIKWKTIKKIWNNEISIRWKAEIFR